MNRVSILDYGSGNLGSVFRALQRFGNVELSLVSDPAKLIGADRVVLPGVGAFGECIRKFDNMGFSSALRDFVASGRPLLGICVGMQMLFDHSEEYGLHSGLSLIPGGVTYLRPGTDDQGLSFKVPNVGWGKLKRLTEIKHNILSGSRDSDYFYFLHSYACRPENFSHCLALAQYGDDQYAAVVRKDNVFGCQFHPEKSGEAGLAVLDSFLKI